MEIRKDYVLDKYVIIASNRGKRPSYFKTPLETETDIKEIDENCPFCPGNEDKTPKEKGRVVFSEVYNTVSDEEKNKWLIRWFDNKFPAVSFENNSYIIRTDNSFYTYSDAYGIHEVIVETPFHNKQLWDLDVLEIEKNIEVYNYRLEELSRIPGVKYVTLFKNHGLRAGTSVVHSHSQIIAYNVIPLEIREMINAIGKFEGCPYCEIIQKEINSEREIIRTENFISFTPYASQFPFEARIYPIKHVRRLNELKGMFNELSIHLNNILKKLKELNCSYNIIWLNSPDEYDLHFSVRIIPRLTTPGGFEFFGTFINVASPEDAAKFYRGDFNE